MAKSQKSKRPGLGEASETNFKEKPLKKLKLKKKRKIEPRAQREPLPSTSTDIFHYSDSDSDSDSVSLSALLEPYTKDQLINLISTASGEYPSLYSFIQQHADQDASHRKIFVHGLSWDTTRQDLLSSFESFGEIEDCNVVTDKGTGKAKGYGFVLFKTRKEAAKALKEPRKKVRDRLACCQLASVGPINVAKEQEGGARRIYVSNVGFGADKEKLKAFFSNFGEIEAGPMGFDQETGRSRGYALFVYKTVEGAKKALEEPYKMFDGQQLHCSIATVGKSKNDQSRGNQQVVQQQQHEQLQQQQQVQLQPSQGQMLAAMAAAQNMALFGQQAGLNYSGLLANPGAAAAVGIISPVMAGALGQGVVPTSSVGGMGVGSQSLLGSLRPGQGLQHVYPNMQIGQAGMGMSQGAGGSISGYPSYI